MRIGRGVIRGFAFSCSVTLLYNSVLYLSLQVRSSGNIVLVHRNFPLLPDVRMQMICNRPVSLEKAVWKNGKNCKLPEPLSLN